MGWKCFYGQFSFPGRLRSQHGLLIVWAFFEKSSQFYVMRESVAVDPSLSCYTVLIQELYYAALCIKPHFPCMHLLCCPLNGFRCSMVNNFIMISLTNTDGWSWLLQIINYFSFSRGRGLFPGCKGALPHVRLNFQFWYSSLSEHNWRSHFIPSAFCRKIISQASLYAASKFMGFMEVLWAEQHGWQEAVCIGKNNLLNSHTSFLSRKLHHDSIENVGPLLPVHGFTSLHQPGVCLVSILTCVTHYFFGNSHLEVTTAQLVLKSSCCIKCTNTFESIFVFQFTGAISCVCLTWWLPCGSLYIISWSRGRHSQKSRFLSLIRDALERKRFSSIKPELMIPHEVWFMALFSVPTCLFCSNLSNWSCVVCLDPTMKAWPIFDSAPSSWWY